MSAKLQEDIAYFALATPTQPPQIRVERRCGKCLVFAGGEARIRQHLPSCNQQLVLERNDNGLLPGSPGPLCELTFTIAGR